VNTCMSQMAQTRLTQPIPLSVSAPGVYSSPESPVRNIDIHEPHQVVQAGRDDPLPVPPCLDSMKAPVKSHFMFSIQLPPALWYVRNYSPSNTHVVHTLNLSLPLLPLVSKEECYNLDLLGIVPGFHPAVPPLAFQTVLLTPSRLVKGLSQFFSNTIISSVSNSLTNN